MTIALTNAGWENSKYFITTMILITCISAINSSIYLGSRTIFHWSKDGYGPKILSKVDKRGVPMIAIHFMHVFCFISIMSYKSGSADAYNYIVNIAGIAAFIVWTSVSIIHLRFRKGWLVQKLDLAELPFKSPMFPYFNYLSIFIGVLLTLVQGWTVFKPFQVGQFIDSYILLPFFFIVWFAYDWYYKTWIVRPQDMDFLTGRRPDLDAVIGAEKEGEYRVETTVVDEQDKEKSN
ncbi:unnamed protein product [Ambrosiozyma monospora]|uniref:Unnamed protein product n=1 Tax=Ambrosiozyma monospora TaxID=43982 RepID=A0ACB5TU65_AMBMO|nr:unnamed protein product [Ambrosiozyma monospora]